MCRRAGLVMEGSRAGEAIREVSRVAIVKRGLPYSSVTVSRRGIPTGPAADLPGPGTGPETQFRRKAGRRLRNAGQALWESCSSTPARPLACEVRWRGQNCASQVLWSGGDRHWSRGALSLPSPSLLANNCALAFYFCLCAAATVRTALCAVM